MRIAFALAAALTFGWISPASLFPQQIGQSNTEHSTFPTIPQGEKGLDLLSQGQFKEAIAELHQAVQLAPDSWKYSLGLAEALLSANYNFTGLHFLKDIYPRFHDLPEYHYALGLGNYLCFRYPEAIQEFQTVDNPKFQRIPFLIGNCYMAMGDLKQAETLFRRAIELDPKDPSYYASLGKMLRMEGPGRLDEAAEVLQKAWDLDPHDAYTGLHLAYCREGKGDFAGAQALLEQVVREQPDLQPAHLALATAFEHNHQPEKAREQREIADRLKPPPSLRQPGLGPVTSNFSAH